MSAAQADGDAPGETSTSAAVPPPDVCTTSHDAPTSSTAAAEPSSHTRLRSAPRKFYADDIQSPVTVTFEPIGVARTPYKERFGTPRQPQVVSGGVLGGAEQEGTILLTGLDTERARLSLRGLAGFSHIWAIYHCHLNTGWSALVQPPRGPRQKQGVFATRSPNRPNQIGLSLLRVSRVDEDACAIHYVGGDLINDTPILDVKPYITPYDHAADARHGWLDGITDIVGEPDSLRYYPPPPSLFDEGQAQLSEGGAE